MQRTERRLAVAALFRNSKHQPDRVAVISEAHSFELTFPAPTVELRGAGTLSFTLTDGRQRSRAECRGIPCAVSPDDVDSPMKSKTVFIAARRFESRFPLRS